MSWFLDVTSMQLSRSISISQGHLYQLDVSARDIFGQSATLSQQIVFDTTAPSLRGLSLPGSVVVNNVVWINSRLFCDAHPAAL